MKEFGLEKIIFVCTASPEIFFSKLRSAGLNYSLPSFFTDFNTVQGVSNKHCLLSFHFPKNLDRPITFNSFTLKNTKTELQKYNIFFNKK